MIYFLWTMIGLFVFAIVLKVVYFARGTQYEKPDASIVAVGLLVQIGLLIWAITLVT